MAKQIVITVSESFQTFALETCKRYVGPGVTKQTNLTQVELSDALLALATTPRLVALYDEIDPETGETVEMMQPVELENFIAEILENREVGGGTRSSAKGKLDSAVSTMEKLVAELKALAPDRPQLWKAHEDELARLMGKKAAETPAPALEADSVDVTPEADSAPVGALPPPLPAIA